MKLPIRISGLLLLLALTVSSPAEAQFFKKLFKNEKKEKRRQQPPVQQKIKKEAPLPKKDRSIHYPPTVFKARYRIDVLVSLYLDELVVDNKVVYKDRVPEKAAVGVNFYEGIRLAADSLTKLGYQFDIFIHDVTQPDMTPAALIKNYVLEESDLVIGMLSSVHVALIADYAQKKQINFISALSPSDADIRNNPFFTMLQPALITHCQEITGRVFRQYPKHDILLFYRDNIPVDSVAYGFVLEGNEHRYVKVRCNKGLQRAQLEQLFSPTEKNIIVIPVLDPLFAEGILLELDEWFPGFQFEVYGMPSWRSITTLKKQDSYPDIIVLFSAPYYFDYSHPLGQTIHTQYKKEFRGKSGEMVFWAYEILFRYARLLQTYGTIFNQQQHTTGNPFFTRFDIHTRWSPDNDLYYHENRQVCLYRYQNGSFMVEQ